MLFRNIKHVCKNILCTTLLVTSFYGYGQDKVIDAAPEASALAKSINFPVGYNTGVPNIEVPLYEVKAGSMSLPVKMSYNSGGFKINEKSTDIGLGWSLSTNIQISRSVEGGDDLRGNDGHNWPGYYYNDVGAYYSDVSMYPGGSAGGYPSQTGQDLLRLLDNRYDRQPDRFYYKLLGKSGVFYFQKHYAEYTGGITVSAVTVPNNGVKIEYLCQNVFRITDTDGTVYNFGANDNLNFAPATYTEFTSSPDDAQPVYTATSWKCSEIISPSKTDTIFFTYRTKTMEETRRPCGKN